MFDFEAPTPEQLRDLKDEHGHVYAVSCNNLPDAPKGKSIYFRNFTGEDRSYMNKLVERGEDSVDKMLAESLVVYPSLVEYKKIGDFYTFIHSKIAKQAMHLAGNVDLEEAKKV